MSHETLLYPHILSTYQTVFFFPQKAHSQKHEHSIRFPISCRLGQLHGLQNINLTDVFFVKIQINF
jgi:hypothetical protein